MEWGEWNGLEWLYIWSECMEWGEWSGLVLEMSTWNGLEMDGAVQMGRGRLSKVLGVLGIGTVFLICVSYFRNMNQNKNHYFGRG